MRPMRATGPAQSLDLQATVELSLARDQSCIEFCDRLRECTEGRATGLRSVTEGTRRALSSSFTLPLKRVNARGSCRGTAYDDAP